MNDNQLIRDGREELGLFSYYKVLHYLGNNTVSFESGLGLIANIYYKF